MLVAALTISGRFAHLAPWGDMFVVFIMFYPMVYGELWSNDVLKPKFWICTKQRVFHPGFDEVSADPIKESHPLLSHPLLCGFNDFDCYMLKRSFFYWNLKYGLNLNVLNLLWMYSDIDRDLLFQTILMICFNEKTQVWLKNVVNNHKHTLNIRCIFI